LERTTKINLIVSGAIISMAVAIAILIPNPGTIEVELWLPENATLAKGLPSKVHLSGTVVTIPLETYQELSRTFQEQKVIIQKKVDTHEIVIHYLGNEGPFTYHAIKRFSSYLHINLKTVRLEGSTLKYNPLNVYLPDVAMIGLGILGGIASFLAIRRKYDC
jgi:hypothetical protein